MAGECACVVVVDVHVGVRVLWDDVELVEFGDDGVWGECGDVGCVGVDVWVVGYYCVLVVEW